MATDFEYRPLGPVDLEAVIGLMKSAFPGASIYTPTYLTWLYWQNPVGDAVGVNAWDSKGLVGHVVAVPQAVMLHGKPATVLLLLNIATEHRVRGKGLFLDLIREMIKRAPDLGYAAIIGVANQQTYRGYEKLGFQNVAGLSACVELLPHRIDATPALERAQLWRKWDTASLDWRLRNPANPLKIAAVGPDSITVEGKSSTPLIRARAIVPRRDINPGAMPEASPGFGPAAVLGLTPKGTCRRRLSMNIPGFLKPSPLRLVYLNMRAPSDRIDADNVLFSFLDFDAF